MIINHNLGAMNAQRQMSSNQNDMSNSMEKLSSGLRINRAGDDAAGLAISEKMRGQIRGLEQADRNAQDGISMIQTAEGALNETHSILQRMRELAVQSSNDSNTTTDRQEIQKEVDQLKSEIDRISTDTEFNTKKLLDGSVGTKAIVGGANAAGIESAEVVNDKLESGSYSVEVSSVTQNADVSSTNNTTALSSFATNNGVANGEYSVELTSTGNTNEFDISIKDTKSGKEIAASSAETINTTSANVTTSVGDFDLTWDSGASVAAGKSEISVNTDATLAVKNSDGDTIQSKDIVGNNAGETEVGGFKFNFDSSLTAGTDTEITVDNDALTFHIGANEGQNTRLAIKDMSASALKVSDLDVTTQGDADEAITKINDAIASVSSERSKLGANQNRLEHTINNLGTSAENLQSAESRIRDVDMAKEMMNMTKNNILSQASQSMLAQANQQPQSVLQLLQ